MGEQSQRNQSKVYIWAKASVFVQHALDISLVLGHSKPLSSRLPLHLSRSAIRQWEAIAHRCRTTSTVSYAPHLSLMESTSSCWPDQSRVQARRSPALIFRQYHLLSCRLDGDGHGSGRIQRREPNLRCP